MRSLTELTTTEDPAWPWVRQCIAAAPNVEVLPAEQGRAEAALLQLQVTLRAPMGAVVFHTGGLLIDHGWLRVLGSGHARLNRSLPQWNEGKAPCEADGRPSFVLVADDLLGGLFAVNGGALGDQLGEVFYLAPDTLQWEGLSVGYTDFLSWALSPRVAAFYRTLRWHGWEDEAARLTGDQAIAVYPFLWAEGPGIAQRSRKVVRAEELYALHQDLISQLSR